jgi:hypothetical protein
MKINRIIWGLVSLLVLITIAVSVGMFPSQGQERSKKDPDSTPKPLPSDNRDLSKYGSVQFDSPVSASPNDERWFANQRYDNLGWVFSSVLNNPRAAGVGRFTHNAIASDLPVQESSLIVLGEVISVKTFLSNDRRGVYSEFAIKPDDVLKDSERISQKTILADREGGVVIYPNGQRILYQSSILALPELGGRYLFFLRKEGESPNYEILASYDVAGENVYRLEESKERTDEQKDSKARFLDTVRTKIAANR